MVWGRAEDHGLSGADDGLEQQTMVWGPSGPWFGEGGAAPQTMV